MKKFGMLFFGLLISVATLAKDLGQTGPVYPIAEPDLLQAIQAKLQVLQDSGELSNLQKTMKHNVLQTINEPEAVLGLKTVMHRRQWLFDPSIVLSKTFYAANGEVIAKAGQSINPLDAVSLKAPLLFFDARSEEQQRWALKRYHAFHEKAVLILTGGKIIDLMKHWEMPLYFDQGGRLTARFNIKAIPTVVTQENNRLLITEEPVV